MAFLERSSDGLYRNRDQNKTVIRISIGRVIPTNSSDKLVLPSIDSIRAMIIVSMDICKPITVKN